MSDIDDLLPTRNRESSACIDDGILTNNSKSKQEQQPEQNNEVEFYEKQKESVNNYYGQLFFDDVVVVRAGQLNINLSNRNVTDDLIQSLCLWLDSVKIQSLLSSYRHVKRRGVIIEINNNLITGLSISALIEVFQKHRIPITNLNAFRNKISDDAIDPIVEYLYIQNKAAPLHTLRISHNEITDDGAYRLLVAINKCGVYPTRISKKPLWLRLEYNNIVDPVGILDKLHSQGHNVCCVDTGTCSDPQCNHVNVIVQSQYFLQQHTNRKMNAPPGL